VLNDLISSLTSPSAYRRFAGEKAGRTAAYAAFLSLIFVAALAVAIKLRLTPLFDQTFEWLKTSMPAVTFAAGKVSSTALTPTRVEHPRAKEVAVMIDTSRTEPVTPALMKEANVIAYLTGNALYLERDNRIEIFDLSKSAAGKTVTVNADTYREMEKVFNWVFYPVVLLLFFVLYCVSLSFFGLIYSLAGLLVASLTGAELSFGTIFQMSLHAQSAAVLLRAVDSLSPKSIPLAGMISMAMSVTYLTLAIRASGRPEPAQPPPAA